MPAATPNIVDEHRNDRVGAAAPLAFVTSLVEESTKGEHLRLRASELFSQGVLSPVVGLQILRQQ
jgi:hypothetical protein